MRTTLSIVACALLLGACATPPGVSEESVPPKVIFQIKPVYPFAMVQAKKEGMALIGFIVTADGNVADAQVIEATDPLFGLAAVTCVRQWKFIPGRIGGRKVNSRLGLPIYFTLEDEPEQSQGSDSTAGATGASTSATPPPPKARP